MRPQTNHEKPENMFLEFLTHTILTILGDNCELSWVEFYKPRKKKYCLVNVDDNGKGQYLTRSECEGF
jgi:hypothetical protein